jgi:hypothetical protein
LQKKTILSKRVKGAFKKSSQKGTEKNRNESHNDRNIEFLSINENCRAHGGKISAESNKESGG